MMFILFAGFLNHKVSAQVQCGHYDAMQELYKAHPEFRQHQRALLEHNKEFIKNSDGSTRSVYIIPVVFKLPRVVKRYQIIDIAQKNSQ